MSSTSHIINAGQAAILQALRDAARLLTLAELQAATSLKESTFRRCHADLRERGYITADRKPGGNHFLFLELSDLGAHALDTHYKRLSGAEAIACEHVAPQHIATSPDNSVWDRPILTLGMCGYTRNNGNAHIASRGQRC